MQPRMCTGAQDCVTKGGSGLGEHDLEVEDTGVELDETVEIVGEYGDVVHASDEGHTNAPRFGR